MDGRREGRRRGGLAGFTLQKKTQRSFDEVLAQLTAGAGRHEIGRPARPHHHEWWWCWHEQSCLAGFCAFAPLSAFCDEVELSDVCAMTALTS
jgi:hypothetical protein